jgi:Asp-tRNA(Asn)/Glu-tRNA(Gln) amidotransferase A subunit family amidase
MDTEALCFMPAAMISAAVRSGDLSAAEVTEAVLQRIDAINPLINAFVTLVPEIARAQARAIDDTRANGGPLGPLAGVPVSIKDLSPTAGIRTTFGSKPFAENIPSEDAVYVARLKQAGAIVLGKTNTPEWGYKGATDNLLFGPTRNPWNRSRIAGGSSGGAAAAVAAGLGPIAEGSDGGGSIRIPASCCGVFGFKPSFGRVPRYPTANAWSTLTANGPLTRTVRDAALMLSVMAGRDDRDPFSIDTTEDDLGAVDRGVAGLRVAWSADLGHAAVDPEVRRLCEAGARRFLDLGCSLDEAHPDGGSVKAAWETIFGSNYPLRLGEALEKTPEAIDPNLLRKARIWATLSASDLLRAQIRQTEWYLAVERFFERYDLLLTPTIAVPPFAVEHLGPSEIDERPADPYYDWIPFTYPFNLTGSPACSLPCGFTSGGLPVGLQVVGRRHADATVLAAAGAFEQIAPWADLRPPLAVAATGA